MNTNLDPDDYKPCPYCNGGYTFEEGHYIEAAPYLMDEEGNRVITTSPNYWKGPCPYCDNGYIYNGFDTDMTLEELRAYLATLPKPDLSKLWWRQPGAIKPLSYELTVNLKVFRGGDKCRLMKQAVDIWIKERGELSFGEGF